MMGVPGGHPGTPLLNGRNISWSVGYSPEVRGIPWLDGSNFSQEARFSPEISEILRIDGRDDLLGREIVPGKQRNSFVGWEKIFSGRKKFPRN